MTVSEEQKRGEEGGGEEEEEEREEEGHRGRKRMLTSDTAESERGMTGRFVERS
jgi:hypothetical protein